MLRTNGNFRLHALWRIGILKLQSLFVLVSVKLKIITHITSISLSNKFKVWKNEKGFGNRTMDTRTKDLFAIYMSYLKGEGKCNWDTQKWFCLFLHFDFAMAGWLLLFRNFYLDYFLPSKASGPKWNILWRMHH